MAREHPPLHAVELGKLILMNICQVLFSDGWGGAETVVYELSKHFRDRGENVSILLNHEIMQYYADLGGVKLLDIGPLFPPESGILGKARSFRAPRLVRRGLVGVYSYLDEWLRLRHFEATGPQITRFFADEQIDVVHTHLPHAAFLVSSLAGRRPPTVVTLHGEQDLRGVIPINPLREPLVNKQATRFKRALASADAVTGVSSFIVQAWREAGAKMNSSAVIYNGIELSDFTPYQESPSAKVSGFNLLFPGGRKWVKGGDLVIEALSVVKREIPDVHLNVALEVPMDHALRKMVKNLGLESNVSFVGFLSKDEYRRLLASADLLVMPSREEAFANVYLEAMAMGKPIVAGRTGGTPELIMNETNGILVEPRRDQVAASILRLYHDEPLRERIRENNLHDVTRFDWGPVIDQYLELYGRMLRKERGGRALLRD